MTKLAKLVATCVLVVSVSTVALADGGQTQGTGLVSPPPPVAECETGCPENVTFTPQEPSPVDTLTLANLFMIWLPESIL